MQTKSNLLQPKVRIRQKCKDVIQYEHSKGDDVMYKVLADEAKVKIGDKWHTLTVILTEVSGGKRVEYLDADGTVLKSEAYSRSQYRIVEEV